MVATMESPWDSLVLEQVGSKALVSLSSPKAIQVSMSAHLEQELWHHHHPFGWRCSRHLSAAAVPRQLQEVLDRCRQVLHQPPLAQRHAQPP